MCYFCECDLKFDYKYEMSGFPHPDIFTFQYFYLLPYFLAGVFVASFGRTFDTNLFEFAINTLLWRGYNDIKCSRQTLQTK